MIINGLTEKIIGVGSKDNLWELSTTMVDGLRSRREFLALGLPCAVSSFEKGAQRAPYERTSCSSFLRGEYSAHAWWRHSRAGSLR